jgi:hypothetical protein
MCILNRPTTLRKIAMTISYPLVSKLASALCFILFICLLLAPSLIYWIFGLDGNEVSDLIARRAAMMFMGLAAIIFLSRNAEPSQLRQSLCLGLAIMMGALAIIGIFEFLRGAVGVGIWLAITTEITFALAYFKLSKQA